MISSRRSTWGDPGVDDRSLKLGLQLEPEREGPDGSSPGAAQASIGAGGGAPCTLGGGAAGIGMCESGEMGLHREGLLRTGGSTDAGLPNGRR